MLRAALLHVVLATACSDPLDEQDPIPNDFEMVYDRADVVTTGWRCVADGFPTEVHGGPAWFIRSEAEPCTLIDDVSMWCRRTDDPVGANGFTTTITVNLDRVTGSIDVVDRPMGGPGMCEGHVDVMIVPIQPLM